MAPGISKIAASALLALAFLSAAEAQPMQDEQVGGFRRVARYVDAAGSEVGARFAHGDTGLGLVVLRIESTPQVFLHVGTPPNSDRGEPHTQEHLLLGKGSKGKAVAVSQDMSMVESTAYTAQTHTVYSFNCAAGKETFFRVLDETVDALLFPNYTDEEIRREVWHLGAARDARSGQLELADRGTVFNEMLVSYEKRWNVWYELEKRLYGEAHELSYASGGEPNAIRTMTPEHIHAFHRATYHLSPNLGLIVSLPPSIPTSEFLGRFGETVARLAAHPAHQERSREKLPIPPIRPQSDRAVFVVPYPNQNGEDTGNAVLAWVPRPAGSIAEHLLRRLFLEAFANGETGHLHKLLLDRSTRQVSVEAASMWAGLEVSEAGEGAMIGLTGYAPAGANEADLRAIERAIRAELDALAAFAPGDEALAVFQRRVETRLLELERELKVTLGQPPLFGRRGTRGFWYEHLRLVDRAGGETRSLTLSHAIAQVRAQLAREENPWGAVIDGLGLRNAPHIGVSLASPAEVTRRAEAREERLAAGMQELLQRMGTEDAQEALAKLEAEQEAAVAQLEARDAAIPAPKLVPDVPRTHDDSLQWSEGKLGEVPLFRAQFAAMSAAEVALAFRLEGLRADELVLLPLVPALLQGAGLRPAEGEPLAYDALQDRIQREVLELSASYDLAPWAPRHELLVRAAGADLEETRVALGWLGRCLRETDLSEANLPRLLDLVEQLTRGLRSRLGGSDEGWVRNPAGALRFERDHLYLSAGSYHAQLFQLFRLRWLLTAPPGPGDAEVLEPVFGVLEAAPARADLEGLAQGLREGAPPELADALLGPMLDSLSELAGDLPPSSFQADFAALVRVLRADLSRPPAETLAALRGLLAQLYAPARARAVLTGNPATLDALAPRVAGLLASLSAAPAQAREAGPDLRALRPVVRTRIATRHGAAAAPVHFGLVNETTASGVFLHSCDAPPMTALDREALTGALAGSIYAGAGPHAFFMNTWGAGLAYSNGLRVRPATGRVAYYAERCPDLVQTMRFVVDLARQAPEAARQDLAEYSAANLVSKTRASNRFPQRARAQAAELREGLLPAQVTAYREALLGLCRDESAWEAVRTQAPAMTGRVLVGLGQRSREQPGGVFLTIAPERLLAGYEAYVQEVEGPAEQVYRVYPADLWVWPEAR